MSYVNLFGVNGVTTAQFRVGDATYSVTPGQIFATSFELLTIDGRCSQLLFGDAPFTLCTGEQVMK